jgi:hypothetical protein
MLTIGRLMTKKHLMTQQELRQNVTNYIGSDRLIEEENLLNKFILCFYDLILKHHNDSVTLPHEGDSKLMLQMMLTKLSHLKTALSGINIQKEDGQKGFNNDIIDPIIIATIVRNIYETVCVFILINVLAHTLEEKKIVYNLWVLSGLKYRQKFASVASTIENLQKIEREKEDIDNLIKEIKSTNLYKSLTDKGRSKIDYAIKSKDYKIKIDTALKEVSNLNWQDISNNFVTNTTIFNDIYTYFSLYAHPSNVSVFQYGQMFDPTNNPFLSKTKLMSKYALALSSVFLAEYIKLFPTTINTFEERSDIDQIMLNLYNNLLRGREAAINEKWKMLG